MVDKQKRRTKIVTTLGPATSDEASLKALIEAGADVVRLNLSHGSHEDHQQRAQLVRRLSAELGKVVGVLIDLQGPKIRIARFKEDKVQLRKGQSFALDASLPDDAGDSQQVGIAYKDLPNDVNVSDILLLNDGLIVLQATAIQASRVETTVVTGGVLSNNKGINLKGGGLSAPAITEKDIDDIQLAAKIKAEFVAISFVRSRADVDQARQLVTEAGHPDAAIVSKIERAEAIDHLDDIIQASDVVMVARGDLGVEIDVAGVPAVQKRIIAKARTYNKVSITATQMMESMIDNPIPTRAEVSDVANAVLDGTDAVMLSAESAVGKYPAETVAAMQGVCLAAESNIEAIAPANRLKGPFNRVDEAIALASMFTANNMEVAAIVALTESGKSALTMSRINSSLPIYAITRHHLTAGKCALYRGVLPVIITEDIEQQSEHVRELVGGRLKEGALVESGDLIIVTQGDLMGVCGQTNTMKILRI